MKGEVPRGFQHVVTHDNCPDPSSPPRVLISGPAPCPACGCDKTYSIEVRFDPEKANGYLPFILLSVSEGEEIIGNYVGCPACQFASPMLSRVGPKRAAHG